jgi:hypothetical protein
VQSNQQQPKPAKKANRKTQIELSRRYAAANRECAEIILLDALRYGGPDSLMVQWAHEILKRYPAAQPDDWSLVA